MEVLALRSIEQDKKGCFNSPRGIEKLLTGCHQAHVRALTPRHSQMTSEFSAYDVLSMHFWLHAIKQVHHDSYPTASFCNTPEKKEIEREREKERDVYIIL